MTTPSLGPESIRGVVGISAIVSAAVLFTYLLMTWRTNKGKRVLPPPKLRVEGYPPTQPSSTLRVSDAIEEGSQIMTNWPNEFDAVFPSLTGASSPEIMEKIVPEVEVLLARLEYSSVTAWSEEVRSRLAGFIGYAQIALRLSDPAQKERCLRWLDTIFLKADKGDRLVVKLIREGCTDVIDSLYRQREFAMNPQVVDLLQRLHEYDEVYMYGLIDDALNKWTDERFRQMRSAILLSEVKVRNDAAFQRMRQRLIGVRNNAVKDSDAATLDRANQLLDPIRYL